MIPFQDGKFCYFDDKLVYSCGDSLFINYSCVKSFGQAIRCVSSFGKYLTLTLYSKVIILTDQFEIWEYVDTFARKAIYYDGILVCLSYYTLIRIGHLYKTINFFALNAQIHEYRIYLYNTYKIIEISCDFTQRNFLNTAELIYFFKLDYLLLIYYAQILYGKQAINLPARILSADYYNNLLAISTVENYVFIYYRNDDKFLYIQQFGERFEPGKSCICRFCNGYLIVCSEHSFSTVYSINNYQIVYQLPGAHRIVKILQFGDYYLIFYPFQVLLLTSSFYAHSLVLAAGCEIYDVIQVNNYYITLSDEASIRKFCLPGYLNGDGDYAGHASSLTLSIEPLNKYDAKIELSQSFYYFGRRGDTFWPEIFYSGQLSGGKCTYAIMHDNLMYCVCNPGRIDEYGIEVYYLEEKNIKLVYGLLPQSESRFVRIVHSDGVLMCSNEGGYLFNLIDYGLVELIKIDGFKGYFYLARKNIYAIVGQYLILYDGEMKSSVIGYATDVFCVDNYIFYGLNSTLFALSGKQINMSGYTTFIGRFNDCYMIGDENGYISLYKTIFE